MYHQYIIPAIICEPHLEISKVIDKYKQMNPCICCSTLSLHHAFTPPSLSFPPMRLLVAFLRFFWEKASVASRSVLTKPSVKASRPAESNSKVSFGTEEETDRVYVD